MDSTRLSGKLSTQYRNVPDSLVDTYKIIVGLSGKRGYCFARTETLSEMLGISRVHVWRRLNHLRDIGLLDIQRVPKTHERRLIPLLAPVQLPRVSKEGVVYLVEGAGRYKIGQSRDASRRVKGISVAVPFDLTLIHVIKTNDVIRAEKYWHEKFAHRRIQGEWFTLMRYEVMEFQDVSFMNWGWAIE